MIRVFSEIIHISNYQILYYDKIYAFLDGINKNVESQ